VLRIERLTLACERLATLIESIPADRLREGLPDELALAERLVRSVGRLDLIERSRAMAIDSLRRLPDRAAQSPAAIDAWLQHAIALVAWLDGQSDQTPPLLERASAPATEWPSSDDQAPARPLS
jgi:hypothetical protein